MAERSFKKNLFVYTAFLALAFILSAYLSAHSLKEKYETLLSSRIVDRHGVAIKKYPNQKGLYATEIPKLPDELEELLLSREDKYFYFHPGINPVSTLRAVLRYATGGDAGPSSTLTQQLVKVLLGNESERTLANKLQEFGYSLSLELFSSKEEILSMYINSVNLGNQSQGFEEAALLYFDKHAKELTEQELIQLLSSLTNPSNKNPWKTAGWESSVALAGALDVDLYESQRAKQTGHSYQTETAFEIQSLGLGCENGCALTIDEELNETIRDILKEKILEAKRRGVEHGAVVVIDARTNELLALVGSQSPYSNAPGSQINMALEPRPVGSTIKPFIYGKAFEKGLRPYTLVDDREYKYPIASGQSLYPKNFDGTYRGVVTLHEALSNSLNTPTVKTLEYIGLEEFYHFFEESLSFTPIQDWDSYQYGIALGGLEMDLLTLSHFFTAFPNNGLLKPLVVSYDNVGEGFHAPQNKVEQPRVILEKKYVALINAILNDRERGVSQFGAKSNLHLTQRNYGVKTGTSRDFHDSWVVGYTPDFVVGVWVGNAQNTALDQVTGQVGAGAIWKDVMEYLFTTNYNRGTPLDTSSVESFVIDDSLEFGLAGDDVALHQKLLLDDVLVLSPHQGDVFAFSPSLTIPLTSKEVATWYINGTPFGQGEHVSFSPARVGSYEIEARTESKRELIQITVTLE